MPLAYSASAYVNATYGAPQLPRDIKWCGDTMSRGGVKKITVAWINEAWAWDDTSYSRLYLSGPYFTGIRLELADGARRPCIKLAATVACPTSLILKPLTHIAAAF